MIDGQSPQSDRLASNWDVLNIASSIAGRGGGSRDELFRAMHHQTLPPGVGIRVVAADGEVLAWWGDELRVSGAITYGFDATSLYITRSRNISTPAVTVQAFERV